MVIAIAVLPQPALKADELAITVMGGTCADSSLTRTTTCPALGNLAVACWSTRQPFLPSGVFGTTSVSLNSPPCPGLPVLIGPSFACPRRRGLTCLREADAFSTKTAISAISFGLELSCSSRYLLIRDVCKSAGIEGLSCTISKILWSDISDKIIDATLSKR